MMNRESVEQLRAKLQVDLANTLNSARQIEGAIAACDRLIADDDAAIASAKAAKKKTK
jgi:hypothetical protein